MLRTACTTQPEYRVTPKSQLLSNPIKQALHAVITEMLSHELQGVCRSAELTATSDELCYVVAAARCSSAAVRHGRLLLLPASNPQSRAGQDGSSNSV